MGDPLTRLSPAPSLSRGVLAGALRVPALLRWLISKALVSEVHLSRIIRRSLVILAVAMLVGTGLLVNRRDGLPKQTGEMLESAKCS
jgi:hypothetical protein